MQIGKPLLFRLAAIRQKITTLFVGGDGNEKPALIISMRIRSNDLNYCYGGINTLLNENIKRLRQKSALTQKELADMLHVTAQAVSRWETGDVEPSIGTINEMAKIFKVTTDELINGEKADDADRKKAEPVTEVRYVEQPKPVLAVCEQCNKPIYDGKEIVRIPHYSRHSTTYKVLCKNCDTENKKNAHNAAVFHGEEQRKKSFIFGGLISGAALVVGLIATLAGGASIEVIIAVAVMSILLFPFISCLFLKNNFIGDMVEAVASWGFVKFPGIIFDLSLDGIIWLLTVKLAFWIIGFTLSAACVVLAALLGMVCSVFVYPFALKKSIEHPELTDY